MARTPLSPDAGPAAFSHYDAQGNPIDTNGYIMPGEPKGPSSQPTQPPDWQIATGAGAADAGTFLPDWRPGQPDQAGATDETGTPYDPVVTPPATEKPPATTTPPSGGNTPPPNPYTQPGADNPFAPWSGTFTPPTPAPLPEAPAFTPPTYTPPPAFNYDTPAPVYTPPPAFEYGDFNAPTFTAPPAFSYGDFSYDAFKGPSYDQATSDPGYQFRLQQGTDRLQNAASARGTLNDSGTLKALLDYGQDAASQEYANVWQRDFNAYGANRANAADQYNVNRSNAADIYNKNYQTQYVDPYRNNYQAALDQYTQNRGNALASYNTNYQTQYQDPYNVAKDQWTTGRENALGDYKVNYQTQYQDPYANSYQAAKDAYAPAAANWQTQWQNTQHLNDVANRNAWDSYNLAWQDYEKRRDTSANFALSS
jgi:hypothetical protein